jgi:uncharacterized repeat protein (TIGR01451 family)
MNFLPTLRKPNKKSKSIHSWLLGISILTALPIATIVSETRPAQAGVARAFTKRYQTQINGTIRIIGNSNTTCSTNATLSSNAGTCNAAQNRSGSGAALNNNGNYIQYVNSAGGVFNSSSADFTLPANAVIKSAGLYWGANTAAGTLTSPPNTAYTVVAGTAAPTPTDKNKVRFKIGGGGYQTLTADVINTANEGLGGGSATVYHAFKDVTSLIKNQAANSTQTYSVADIQAGLGGDRYSGWSLIIVYEDPLEPWRELNVFDGFAITTGGNYTDSSISGFNAPALGTFKAEFGAFGYEGDLGSTGDTFAINGTNLGPPITSSAANNFWDSSVTSLPTAPYNRTPNYTNTFGLDIDLFSLTTGATGIIKNGDTSASLRFESQTRGETFYPGAFTLTVDASAISGRVFEDVNYGGGSGRNYTTANASALASGFPLTVTGSNDRIGSSGAIVELYDDAGNFVATTTTDAQGRYGFSQNIKIGSYFIRVVNSSVKSVRPGNTAPGLIPVPTFQTDGVTGLATPNTNLVGGKDPTKADSAANTTNQNLNDFFAQSVSKVVVAENDAVPDTDFGFNFDAIVNTNDSGQGSLRQFIVNSNALTNTGLNQVTNPSPAAGTTAVDPAAGEEASIFMIPDGNARPGLRAGLTSQLTSGVAVITPTTQLPTITDTFTTIDGRTQTANVGDNNSGQQGTGGIVGVDNLTLSKVNKPEVQISGISTINNGFTVGGSNTTIRETAIYGFGNALAKGNIVINSNANNPLIEQNFLGSTALNFSQPSGGNKGSNIVINNISTNGIVQNNLIGYADNFGLIGLGNDSGWKVQNNEIRDNSFNDPVRDGISFESGSSNNQVIGNLIISQGGNGIDSWNASGTLTIENNTITGNGLGSTTAIGETPGIRLYGTGNRVYRNVIFDNYGAGVMVTNGSTRNLISQNSIYGNGTVISTNGTAASGQIGIDLLISSNNANTGTAPYVSANDGVATTGGNVGMDYPVITSSTLSGSTLTVKGFVGNNPVGSTTFAGAILEFFVSEGTNQNNGEVIVGDGKSKPHGEGKTYIGSCTADGNGLFGTVASPCVLSNVPTALTDANNITSTARDAADNTSEFSAGPIADNPNVLLVKRITAINGATTNPNDGTVLSTFVDDGTAGNNDNNANWPTNFLKGAIDAGKVKPGDEVEYTVYFLSNGNANAREVAICDVVPDHMTFVKNTYGVELGIGLGFDSTALPTTPNLKLSNLLNDDQGDFYGAGTTPPANLCKKVNSANTLVNVNGTNNDNGAIVVKIQDLPKANTPGSPTNSYGFIRFRAKVK